MWEQHMVNVAFSPSRMKAQNTTTAQLLIMETLHGVITSWAGERNGEIAKKVSAHGYD